MFKSCKRSTLKLFGEKGLKGATLTTENDEEDIIHFLVTERKQPNFLKYSNKIDYVPNPHEIINQYTAHETQLFLKVNLSLAADAAVIEEYSEYIWKLRNSIFTQPLFDDCLLYRGVDLSKEEMQRMEELGTFFIPSFTSTSIDSKKAYTRSAMFVVKVPYACQYACSITPALSKYYNEEREVLIACYSAFRLERVEKVNSVSVLTLYLDELLSCQDSLTKVQYQPVVL